MLVVTFYITCIFSGIIELGAVLWGAGAGYSVDACLGLALAYQIGNILLFFINKKIRRIQPAFAFVAVIFAAGTVFLHHKLLLYICAFMCFALLSTIIQTLRSAVKSKEPRWRKRVFRVMGFLLSAVMYSHGSHTLLAISISTFVLTVCSPRFEDDCWLRALIKGEYGKNRICITMTVHQMHYFVYCYSMLLMTLFIYKKSILATFWFIANWIPYIITEPLIKSTKSRKWLLFFTAGHLIVASLLLGMYISIESYSLIAMLLWTLTGFGGGNVFCIKESLLKYKEYHEKVWVFSENVGHLFGVVFALLVNHFFRSLKPTLLLGFVFALLTIVLMRLTIVNCKRKSVGAEANKA